MVKTFEIKRDKGEKEIRFDICEVTNGKWKADELVLLPAGVLLML